MFIASPPQLIPTNETDLRAINRLCLLCSFSETASGGGPEMTRSKLMIKSEKKNQLGSIDRSIC